MVKRIAAEAAFPRFWVAFIGLTVATLVASVGFAASPTTAGSLGVGLGSGTWANGLSARYNLTAGTAVQANAGNYAAYGKAKSLGFALSADYIAYRHTLKRAGPVDIGYNLGVGVGLGAFSNATLVRAAGVAGLEFNLNKFPLDVVLEFRPNVQIVPTVDLHLVYLTGHIRYYL